MRSKIGVRSVVAVEGTLFLVDLHWVCPITLQTLRLVYLSIAQLESCPVVCLCAAPRTQTQIIHQR